jgi:hypothetical protein
LVELDLAGEVEHLQVERAEGPVAQSWIEMSVGPSTR